MLALLFILLHVASVATLLVPKPGTMSALSYQKGLKARYKTFLERELSKIHPLLSEKLDHDNIDSVLHRTGLLLNKIKDLSVKYDCACEKYVSMAEEAGSKEELAKLLDSELENSAFCDQVLQGIAELSTFEKELIGSKIKVESKPSSEISETLSRMADLLEAQHFQLQHQIQRRESRDQQDSSHVSVRLPTLDMPSFGGNILAWKPFWDLFESSVDMNSKLSSAEKLTYLKSKLFGEALQAIEGLELSNENYGVVKELLCERYGDKQLIVNAHYTQLMDLPAVSNNIGKLRLLYDELEKHLRSLEAQGEDISQAIFVSLIVSKIPKDVLIHLEIQKGKDNWSVMKLRTLFGDYISAREAAERVSSLQQPNNNKKDNTRSNLVHSASPSREFQYPSRSTAEALVTGAGVPTGQPQTGCRFCGGLHWTDECNVYTSVDTRKQRVKGCCYLCLEKGHRFNQCKNDRPCFHCRKVGLHHRSLCPAKYTTSVNESSNLNGEIPLDLSESSAEQSMLSSGETVLMQTATTLVRKPNTETGQNVRLLLDSGSQRTYITTDLANSLGLTIDTTQEEINVVTFGSNKPQKIKTSLTTLEIKLTDGTYQHIRANVVSHITGKLHRSPVNLENCESWKYLWQDQYLADNLPNHVEVSNLNLLVGNDYYLDIILPQKVELSTGLYLLGSRLGWILSGRTVTSPDNTSSSSLLLLTLDKHLRAEPCMLIAPDSSMPIKPNLEEFWSLETIGITDSANDLSDDSAIRQFNETLQTKNERYFVTWPWKEPEPDLPENYGLALGRLKSLLNRLRKHSDLYQKYNTIIQEQENKGIIERVDFNSVKGPIQHYIPHHAVITPSKSTTKVRIVYDASAKTNPTNKSLNQCLHRGPILLQDLCGLLLRFRLFQIAIMADIEKAFLQVGLQEPDRDVTRFLWLKDPQLKTLENNLQVYRFCSVPFGVISSPFLLASTINHHMETIGTPTAEKIRDNMYVDNLITGCNDVSEAYNFYVESKTLFTEASMNLREWATNSPEFRQYIPQHDLDGREEPSVLGISWQAKTDMLTVNVQPIDSSIQPTKREVLKYIASVFDPLGFFSPVLLLAKIFLQNLWKLKIGWDDLLTQDNRDEWTAINTELQQIKTVTIPRYVGLSITDVGNKHQLLCFCDSSTKAYATSIYLRTSSGTETTTRLIFAKTRLAPTKPITVPRLELLAVFIGMRALNFVKTQLKLIDVEKFVWTDSSCVLAWIKSEKSFGVFVDNRLKEIKSHTDVQFRYICSEDNPADLATRGISLEGLQFSPLWRGPVWLATPVEEWPTWNIPPSTVDAKQEGKSANDKQVLFEATMLADQPQVTPDMSVISPGHFSSLSRLLRVTAWVLRFIKNLKRQKKIHDLLTAEEVSEAKDVWVKIVQRAHFQEVIFAIQHGQRNSLQQQLGLYIVSDGLLRCHGRLGNAELASSTINPILLPKSDPFTALVIEKYHRILLHTGVSQTLAQVRKEFWIPQGRSAVKKQLNKCTTCRRFEGGPFKPPVMPPLPKERVTQSPPFSFTGIDYMGPVYIQTGSKVTKAWICLFTCMSIRAVHLELVMDMTAHSFLLCLRRFVARRGVPQRIVSDNAPQFKMIKTVLDKCLKQAFTCENVKKFSADRGIRWQFITELSPWMGGFYERLVGLVKRCLRKSIGKALLSMVHMQTFLTEVEAVVNSRPLTYVDDDLNSTTAISPSDFLTLNPRNTLPGPQNDNSDPDYQPRGLSSDTILQSWKKGQRRLDQFWHCWKNEYLLSLRERSQSSLKGPRIQSSAQPQVGDVVLIKDNLPRPSWRIGRIRSFYKGRDELVRAASVLLPTGKTINRPLTLLYPLECKSNQDQDMSSNELTHSKPTVKSLDNSDRTQPRQAAIIAKKRIYEQFN